MVTLIWDYIIWHYTLGLRELLAISGNFLWFAYHFFSLKLLLRTLITPFKRVRIEYTRTMKLEEIAENVAANLFMRGVGFIMRSVVLLLGTLTEVGILLASSIAMVIWIFFPLVLVGLLATSLILLLSAGY